jgi:predicted DNA-binding transcriptional regulator AlpA
MRKPNKPNATHEKRPDIDPGCVKYITQPQLRVRYGGRSLGWFERLIARDPSFPKPVVLGARHRLWSLSEIESWERQRAAARSQ